MNRRLPERDMSLKIIFGEPPGKEHQGVLTRSGTRLVDLRSGWKQPWTQPLTILECKKYALRFVVHEKAHTCESSTFEIGLTAPYVECRQGHDMSGFTMIVEGEEFFWMGQKRESILVLKASIKDVTIRVRITRDGEEQCNDCDSMDLQVRLFPCDGSLPILYTMPIVVRMRHSHCGE